MQKHTNEIMRITDIQTFDLCCGIEPSFGWSQGWIDQRHTTIREELCINPFKQEDSSIAVPDGPGLGIEIDEEAVKRMAKL